MLDPRGRRIVGTICRIHCATPVTVHQQWVARDGYPLFYDSFPIPPGRRLPGSPPAASKDCKSRQSFRSSTGMSGRFSFKVRFDTGTGSALDMELFLMIPWFRI